MLNIKAFLEPISESAPCGEDLAYDSLFAEMERACEEVPERTMGSSLIKAIPPDWGFVRERSLELMASTRDLRVAVNLCIAGLHTNGLPSFQQGLELISLMLAHYWECLHPKLDQDDSDPALMRKNTLTILADNSFIVSFKKQPIMSSNTLGKLSILDIETNQRFKNSTKNEEKQIYHQMEAIFKEVAEDKSSLTHTINLLVRCIKNLSEISTLFREKAGEAQSLDLSELDKILNTTIRLIENQIPPEEKNETQTQNTLQSEKIINNTKGTSNTNFNIDNEFMNIQDRGSVIEAIDKICKYYDNNEPSSPIPLLLRRAQNLVNKNFYEIIEDISPDSTSQIKKLLGTEKK